MKNPTIILRTTSNCNLACQYCYDKEYGYHQEKSNKMFLENIENMVDCIQKTRVEPTRPVKIILHGGEPLLISASTYEKFFDALLQKIDKIRLFVQTNGTLFTEEMIQLFKKYNVSIGISLDGSDEHQNASRVYPDGTNSFQKVQEAIQLLNKTNTKFGLIITLTKNNIGCEQKIYDFIANNQLYCSIRPAFPTASGDNSTIMTNAEYEQFFKNLFDIWYQDNKKTVKLKQVSDLYDEFVKVIHPQKFKCSCTASENCFGNFLSLDIYGNVYTCNRTYNLPAFFLGNLKQDSIEAVLQKCNSFKENRKRVIENSACMECKLYPFCHGGCPENSYELYGDYQLPYTYFCDAQKHIFDYIKDILNQNQQIESYQEKIGEIENERKTI